MANLLFLKICVTYTAENLLKGAFCQSKESLLILPKSVEKRLSYDEFFNLSPEEEEGEGGEEKRHVKTRLRLVKILVYILKILLHGKLHVKKEKFQYCPEFCYGG